MSRAKGILPMLVALGVSQGAVAQGFPNLGSFMGAGGNSAVANLVAGTISGMMGQILQSLTAGEQQQRQQALQEAARGPSGSSASWTTHAWRDFRLAEVPGECLVVGIRVGEDKRAWIEAQMNDMMDAAGDDARRYDMLLDVGGNDQLLKRLGAEVQIAQVLDGEGVDPVAVHMLGPDDDDLRYLEDVEDNNLFRPKATVLVVNAGLVPPTSDFTIAFRRVLRSEIVQSVTSPERGGRLVVMPALGCMREFESLGIRSFRAALQDDGPNKIGRLNCVRIRNWLERDMAGVRATLADLLP